MQRPNAMTRSQVRAAMRRMRDHDDEIEEETGEINLVPYMDIVTNIIIFLLASVVNQVALGNVNVSVPTLSAGAGASDEEKPPTSRRSTSPSRSAPPASRSPPRAGCSRYPQAAERPVRLHLADRQAAGDQVGARQRRGDQGQLQRRRQRSPTMSSSPRWTPCARTTTAKSCSPTSPSRQGFSDADADGGRCRASLARRPSAPSRASCPSPTSSKT